MTPRKLTPQQQQTLITEVSALHDAGYTLLPIKTDGSKSPSVLWAEIARGREQPMAIEKIIRLIESEQCDGIGLIMGKASNNAESIELEGRVMHRFAELIEYAVSVTADDLLEKLLAGFVDRSPSGGLHFHYRISDSAVGPNTTFARRPSPDDPEKLIVLAESRGQGGYMICAPSGGRTHAMGLPYVRFAGGPATTPVFTRQEVDELHRLFKYLDEMPVGVAGKAAGAGSGQAGRPRRPGESLLPGDDFNNRARWSEILAGWTIVTASTGPDGETRTHWRRPGKAIGCSATTFGEDGPLFVFSTSTKLPTEVGLTKFAAYCHLNHDGDFAAAARNLAEKGYGSPGGGLFEYKPFPVDVLPSPLREFVSESAKASNCDPAYIALPALTALAAAIGTSRRVVLKSIWKTYPILWTGLIGESGTLKSVGRRIAIGPVAAIEAKAQRQLKELNREYEARFAAWQREQRAWEKGKGGGPCPTKPTPPVVQRFLIDNVTIEAVGPILLDNPRGVLVAADEIGGWFGSFDRYAAKGKADSAAWLSMYNAEAMRIDRKTGPVKSLYVPRAAVCITGGIPPGSLKQVLGVEHRQSGLAARFLWAYPPRKPKLWNDNEIAPELEADYAHLFEKLHSLEHVSTTDGELIPVDVVLTPEAKALVRPAYNELNQELVNFHGDLAAAWSKLEETTARLALVIHFVRWAGGDKDVNIALVDAQSVERGRALVDWFKYETERVYATLLNGKPGELHEDNKQERLLEFIRGQGGSVSPREVQQHCRWLREPGAAKAALQELMDAGLGEWQEQAGRAVKFGLRDTGQGDDQQKPGVDAREVGVMLSES